MYLKKSYHIFLFILHLKTINKLSNFKAETFPVTSNDFQTPSKEAGLIRGLSKSPSNHAPLISQPSFRNKESGFPSIHSPSNSGIQSLPNLKKIGRNGDGGRDSLRKEEDERKKEEEIWVKKWVDYSNKYGMGYLLTNGTTGVFFNDSTKIVIEAKGR